MLSYNWFGLDEVQWRRTCFRWMGFCLILHLLTAYGSIGHHTPDEHFQILEFLSFKLGKTPLADMPIEYFEKMRPWLEPALFYQITRLLEWAGVHQPSSWAFCFRLLSSLLGWCATFGLAISSSFWFKNHSVRKIALLCLALNWYFPVFHARLMAENWSSSFFIIGLTLVTCLLSQPQQKDWHSTQGRQDSAKPVCLWVFIGLLFGLSITLRVQLIFMVFGLFLWICFTQMRSQNGSKIWNVQAFFALGLGVGTALILGVCVDHWGYGAWVFSPWNYFKYNLLQGKVLENNPVPWWDILRVSFTETWPLLGSIVLITTWIAWIRHPFHILTWSCIPFFLFHELIPHKEFRFFFPVAAVGPICLILSVYSTKTQTWIQSSALRVIFKKLKPIWIILLIYNGIALCTLMVLPLARNIQFQEHISKLFLLSSTSNSSQTQVIYSHQTDFYRMNGGPTYFFRPTTLQLKTFETYSDFQQLLLQAQTPLWLFEDHWSLPSEAASLNPYCQMVYRNLPNFLGTLLFTRDFLHRVQAWTLFSCKLPPLSGAVELKNTEPARH